MNASLKCQRRIRTQGLDSKPAKGFTMRQNKLSSLSDQSLTQNRVVVDQSTHHQQRMTAHYLKIR